MFLYIIQENAKVWFPLLQNPVIQKPSVSLRVGELRFFTPVGPEELALQALSPPKRDYIVVFVLFF